MQAGTRQGLPISPLLANIALHVLGRGVERDGQRLGQLVRYCDDFVVLCPTAGRIGPSAGRMHAWLGPLGLHLQLLVRARLGSV